MLTELMGKIITDLIILPFYSKAYTPSEELLKWTRISDSNLETELEEPERARSIAAFKSAMLRNAPRQLADAYLRRTARNLNFNSFDQLKNFLQKERDDDDEFKSPTQEQVSSMFCNRFDFSAPQPAAVHSFLSGIGGFVDYCEVYKYRAAQYF